MLQNNPMSGRWRVVGISECHSSASRAGHGAHKKSRVVKQFGIVPSAYVDISQFTKNPGAVEADGVVVTGHSVLLLMETEDEPESQT